MAGLNLCQTCGEPLEVAEDCPACDVFVEPTTETAVAAANGPGSDHAGANEQEQLACAEPTCDAALSPTDARCVFCGTEQATALTLSFPRGELRLTEFPAVIGRSQSSPAVALCADHDNVSRIHAELVLHERRVHVRDGGPGVAGSTNGTFVNGCRIGTDLMPLSTGDELRLGSDVRVEVRYG